MIRAGNLDTVVQFQAFTASVDAVGSPTQTWAAIAGAPTRAQRIPLRGSELIEASKLTAMEPVKLRVRRDERILPEGRAVIGGKIFNVTSVEDYGRKNDMVLWCDTDGEVYTASDVVGMDYDGAWVGYTSVWTQYTLAWT